MASYFRNHFHPPSASLIPVLFFTILTCLPLCLFAARSGPAAADSTGTVTTTTHAITTTTNNNSNVDGRSHNSNHHVGTSPLPSLYLPPCNFFLFGCPYTVQVENGVPRSKMTVLCESNEGDKQWGVHVLLYRMRYTWDFVPNVVFNPTVYTCDWSWGSKKVKFEAFNKDLASEYGDFYFYYLAGEQGIYLSTKFKPMANDYILKHRWT